MTGPRRRQLAERRPGERPGQGGLRQELRNAAGTFQKAAPRCSRPQAEGDVGTGGRRARYRSAKTAPMATPSTSVNQIQNIWEKRVSPKTLTGPPPACQKLSHDPAARTLSWGRRCPVTCP